MSGICGLLRLDGALAQGIEAMTAGLARRGPDGTRFWHEGHTALGHALNATTPEALHEVFPLLHAGTGCLIVADARIDNREELLAALSLDSLSRVVGDGEIILQSYLKWGEDSPAHLLGDFAYSIWDPRRQTLFAARDHLGARQFAYAHVPGKVLAFATDPRVVLAAPDVARRLNEGRIADFLEYREILDSKSTFFESIIKLQPGHSLVAGPKGVVTRAYWSLEPEPELKLGRPEAYEEAFLEVFTEAVRSRLRSSGHVGATLSGGLDSGSVVAVASRLLGEAGRGPLQTFSAAGPNDEECLETRRIRASLSLPGIEPHLIRWNEPETWRAEVLQLFRTMDEPFDLHMTMLRAAYLCAQRAGVRVVLDGSAGDIVLSRTSHMAWLLRGGQWRKALREGRDAQAFWGYKAALPIRAKELAEAFVPAPLLVGRWMRRTRGRAHTGWTSVLPSLATRSDNQQRQRAYAKMIYRKWPSPLIERVFDITSSTQIVGLERYERVGAAMGVEPRDPFLDLRVVQFAKRLPMDQLQSKGWPKILLRQAMTGTLPDAVVWARGKPHLGATFTHTLFEEPELAKCLNMLKREGGVEQIGPDLVEGALPSIDPYARMALRFWIENLPPIDYRPADVY